MVHFDLVACLLLNALVLFEVVFQRKPFVRRGLEPLLVALLLKDLVLDNTLGPPSECFVPLFQMFHETGPITQEVILHILVCTNVSHNLFATAPVAIAVEVGSVAIVARIANATSSHPSCGVTKKTDALPMG